MQNQRAVEAVYSATYVEDYIDALENLPDEIQRQLTRMREMDIDSQNYIADVKTNMSTLLDLDVRGIQNDEEDKTFTSIKNRIQRLLMSIQEIGDEKIQIAQHIQDFAENRYRQLELDKKTLEQSNRTETHSHESIIQQQSTIRESSGKSGDGATESRGLKRARRARLDPSMSIHTPPSVKANSNAHQSSSAAEKRIERVEAPAHPVNTPVPAPAPTTPAVSTPVVAPTPSTSAASIATTPTASKPARTPAAAASASTSSRRDSEASNSSSVTASQTPKKSSVDLGVPPETPVERKSESTTTRTPKKQYNQQQHEKKQQKAEKKVAAAAAAKKKKSRQVDDSPPMNIQADPDEPTYCLCDQVSYGDMIGCDNDLCPIEWFHFSCVSLSIKPKGKWYCPKCRGERPNIMKPKSIFLKELEKYNREKEEKA